MVTEKKPKKTSGRSPRQTRIQFVVDENGKKTAVVLPIKEYQRLLEDLFDRNLIEQARAEPARSIEEVEARLRKDGLLPA